MMLQKSNNVRNFLTLLFQILMNALIRHAKIMPHVLILAVATIVLVLLDSVEKTAQ